MHLHNTAPDVHAIAKDVNATTLVMCKPHNRTRSSAATTCPMLSAYGMPNASALNFSELISPTTVGARLWLHSEAVSSEHCQTVPSPVI
jgi:hypothetical protein